MTQRQGDAQSKPPPVKKKRAKKAVCTVTKNKDTLNARLEISQMPEALNFKLNLILTDSCQSANKLLLTNIETKVSDIKLTSNDPFWEIEEIEPFDTMTDEYEGPFIALSLTVDSNPRNSMRQHLSGYKLLETPNLDEDEDE